MAVFFLCDDELFDREIDGLIPDGMKRPRRVAEESCVICDVAAGAPCRATGGREMLNFSHSQPVTP